MFFLEFLYTVSLVHQCTLVVDLRCKMFLELVCIVSEVCLDIFVVALFCIVVVAHFHIVLCSQFYRTHVAHLCTVVLAQFYTCTWARCDMIHVALAYKMFWACSYRFVLEHCDKLDVECFDSFGSYLLNIFVWDSWNIAGMEQNYNFVVLHWNCDCHIYFGNHIRNHYFLPAF